MTFCVTFHQYSVVHFSNDGYTLLNVKIVHKIRSLVVSSERPISCAHQKQPSLAPSGPYSVIACEKTGERQTAIMVIRGTTTVYFCSLPDSRHFT